MKQTLPHDLPKDVQLMDVLETEILTVYFYPEFIVVEAFEGINLSYKTGFTILLKVIKLIGSKPCFLISNRINSYSVNPTDYKYLDMIPNLKGIGIVSTTERGRSNAQLEAKFFKKPFKVFDDMKSAYFWGKELLAN